VAEEGGDDVGCARRQSLGRFDHRTAASCLWRRRKIEAFQRLAQRSGVIDEKYVAETGEDPGLVGRRLSVDEASVRAPAEAVSALGQSLEKQLAHATE